MVNIIRKYPFTSLLGLFGFFVGLFLLSLLDFSVSINYNSSEFLENPAKIFFNYIKNSLIILLKGVGLGLVVGISLGFAGFIIDLSRKKPEPVTAEQFPVK